MSGWIVISTSCSGVALMCSRFRRMIVSVLVIDVAVRRGVDVTALMPSSFRFEHRSLDVVARLFLALGESRELEEDLVQVGRRSDRSSTATPSSSRRRGKPGRRAVGSSIRTVTSCPSLYARLSFTEPSEDVCSVAARSLPPSAAPEGPARPSVSSAVRVCRRRSPFRGRSRRSRLRAGRPPRGTGW